MSRVVIDSSSAILLFKAGLFDDLIRLYATFIADTVYRELSPAGYAGADLFVRLYHAGAYEIRSPDRQKSALIEARSPLWSMGRGERDTLLLFDQGTADFIMIDDFRGARYCRDKGWPYVNALLFPRLLALAGELPVIQANAKMDDIRKIGRYSKTVIAHAANLPDAALGPFLPPG